MVPSPSKRPTSRTARNRRRRGVVSVEFAIVAPMFVIVLLGMVEASRLFDLKNQLSIVAREGARMAAMDRDGLVQPGQSPNEKVEIDIRNLLNSNGLPGDDVDIFIVDASDSTTPFDLGDPDNNGLLFELRLELPYSALDGLGGAPGDSLALSTKVVFRNGRSTITSL